MRISDKVFVHFTSGVKKEGTVKAVVGAGDSGFKQLVIGTDNGDIGDDKSGTPHYHDRSASGPYWTQLTENFAPKPVAEIDDEDE